MVVAFVYCGTDYECSGEIDDHHTLILGGFKSVMIYDARTEPWTSPPNDMPEPLRCFSIAGNDKYLRLDC